MNAITTLFGIQYPIIQGGMVWASGWRLASAVSNAGGLGVLGAGSMYPEVLRTHIQKCKTATAYPFGVNIPMLYLNIDEIIEILIEEEVKIVFTSAGNPKTYTSHLKSKGITVVHVVSSLKFALKAQAAGVDAIVVEGFEAGGHNGRDETTTLTLVPLVRENIRIPILAAGGIATGAAMYAVMALGADGVQLGSRFVASHEASSHQAFKERVVAAQEGDTKLTLKELTPVRLLKNKFYEAVTALYAKGGTITELQTLLGRGRAKKGMFEGDMEAGELEIGQVSSLIHEISSVSEIMKHLITEYRATQQRMQQLVLPPRSTDNV